MLDRVERYAIEQSAHGTIVRMRQGGRALALAFVLALFGALYVEDWTITEAAEIPGRCSHIGSTSWIPTGRLASRRA
jgi:hypothetical protein